MAVAAGGGGDALGVLLLHELLPQLGQTPLIATCAWERLRVDPVPGPRGRSGFASLGQVAGWPAEILPGTDTSPPGRSSLPRLVSEADARLFLLDPHDGAVGLATQLTHLTKALDIDALVVVDIGGDAIAAGDEQRLRSPLGDALILAACEAVEVPTIVVVAGPGLDAELTERQVLDRVPSLGGVPLPRLTPPTPDLSRVLGWHPTEATALLASAAKGVRGTVDMRRGDRPVPLTELSPSAWRFTLASVLDGNRQARAVSGSTSLKAADDAALLVGPTELASEIAKAETVSRQTEAAGDLATRVQTAARESSQREADLITTRRLAEAAQVTGPETDELLRRLNELGDDARRGFLWSLPVIADERRWFAAELTS